MRRLPEQLAEVARELPITMSKAQVAEVLRVCERTVDRAVTAGKLRAIKTADGRAGRVLFTRSEVVRFMAERAVGGV
jgi:excisionase family DNA binding protein